MTPSGRIGRLLCPLVGVLLAGCLSRATLEQLQDAPRTAQPLNVVLLLADDLRWDAIGAAGNAIAHTPGIDRLARSGVRFENAFCTTSICPTSRASFATGQYGRRHGIHDFKTPLSPEQLAESWLMVLKRAGYQVGFVGKWGLGGPMPDKAFDHWRGFAGQGRYSIDQQGRRVASDEPGQTDYLSAKQPKHLTARLAEESVEYLENLEPGTPFALQVSFKAPHVQDGGGVSYPSDPAFDGLFLDTVFLAPPSANRLAFEALPELLRASEGRRRWERRLADADRFQESMRGYYRLIAGLDAAVGRILDALERNSLAATTVVVLSSDNGLLLGEHELAGKWLMHEESIRLPMIIASPSLPETRRGAVQADMVLNVDVAPTLVDLAGLAVPPGMQGRSLAPLLHGRDEPWREDWYYEHRFYSKASRIPVVEGLRSQDWKYVEYELGEERVSQLFDLSADPFELDDRASDESQRERRDRMRVRMETIRDALD